MTERLVQRVTVKRVLADEVRMQIVDKDPSVTEHVMKLGLKNHASEFVLWFSIHQSSISQNALFGNHRSLER